MTLDLQEVSTHPGLDLSKPWNPVPIIEPDAREALDAFFDYCLPFCGYISPARINDLFERYTTSKAAVPPDRAALVEACLATGYVRLLYFGRSGRIARSVSEHDRTDVKWFRSCVKTLEDWGSASFTAIRELYRCRRECVASLTPRCTGHFVVLQYSRCGHRSAAYDRFVASGAGKGGGAAF